MSGSWRQVWEERGSSYPSDDVASIDGFDQAFSRTTPEAVGRIIDRLLEALNAKTDDHILEVGCGAGLLMRPMAGHVRVTGTDLAFAMVRRGRGLWPGLQGVQADAVRLPFATGSFNGVFSHGVFLYFPDYAYSRGALAEMRRIAKPGARLFVADVPDLETKDAYLRARTTATTSAAPVWQSSVNGDPGHLYYDRDFFREWAADQGYQVRFSERDVPGYLNGSFRFDVLFRRAPGCYDA